MNKEIKEAAIEVFKSYPTAKKVFITPDGQAFLAKDRAKLHNKEVVTVERNEVMEDEAVKLPAGDKKTAEQLVADMPSVETIAELDVLAEGEKRKTVVAAIEARRTELTQIKE